MYSYNLRYNTYNTYNKYRFLLGGQAITYFSCTQSTCRNKVLHTSSWVQHVSHDFLTRKLRNYGLDAQTVRRIENYLKNRFQMVVITGTGSSWRPVASSVPHRSILGPVLFNLWLGWRNRNASSANLLMIQNGRSGWCPGELCCHSVGSRQAGELGREKPLEIQQRQAQGPSPGEQ